MSTLRDLDDDPAESRRRVRWSAIAVGLGGLAVVPVLDYVDPWLADGFEDDGASLLALLGGLLLAALAVLAAELGLAAAVQALVLKMIGADRIAATLGWTVLATLGLMVLSGIATSLGFFGELLEDDTTDILFTGTLHLLAGGLGRWVVERWSPLVEEFEPDEVDEESELSEEDADEPEPTEDESEPAVSGADDDR
ncbi:MAG: hypothetical protein QM621_12360 [Aeromicrobium sp.]|uniref:hypothetical protein n=1 Tax=Aeromicrobium sp. TaxID=1871063 RepID=UPI0039E5C5D6